MASSDRCAISTPRSPLPTSSRWHEPGWTPAPGTTTRAAPATRSRWPMRTPPGTACAFVLACLPTSRCATCRLRPSAGCCRTRSSWRRWRRTTSPMPMPNEPRRTAPPTREPSSRSRRSPRCRWRRWLPSDPRHHAGSSSTRRPTGKRAATSSTVPPQPRTPRWSSRWTCRCPGIGSVTCATVSSSTWEPTCRRTSPPTSAGSWSCRR